MLKDSEHPLSPEEQEFFRELYISYYNALFVCAYQLGIGREAAEDYVHDAFTIAIRHIEDIKKSNNPKQYLRQALKNVIGYQLRSMRYALKLQQKIEKSLDTFQNEHYTDDLNLETMYRGTISKDHLRKALAEVKPPGTDSSVSPAKIPTERRKDGNEP